MFRAPFFPFGNALEEEFFCGKTLGSRAQTISSVACQKKSENVAAHDFVDKSLCEEGIHLGIYFAHQTV